MIYFFPIIPAVDGGSGSLLPVLLYVNLFFNGIPCILTALALWRTARWFGVRYSWLALIPVADLWVLGNLGDRYRSRAGKKEKHMGRNLPLAGAAALASLLLAMLVLWLVDSVIVAMVSMFLMLAVWGMLLVMRVQALWDLYEGYAFHRKEWFIVLSLFFPFLIPLFIYLCKW